MTTPMATGPLRWMYAALGLVFVGLGYLGSILPVLPTTPFLLLASYCFARSSRRLHRWLRRTPYFGHLIRDWEEHRGIRPRVKATAVTMVTLVVAATVLFSPAPVWAKWTAGGLASLGIVFILFVVPTVPSNSFRSDRPGASEFGTDFSRKSHRDHC